MGGQPSLHFLPGARQRGRMASLDLPHLPALQAGLQLTQQLLPFGDLAQQRAALGHEEVLVVGDHDHARFAEDDLGGAVGAHSGKTVGRQRTKLLDRQCQQLGVLGRDQRPDEVVGTLVDGLEVIQGVIPLIEDQGDVFHLRGQDVVALDQFLGQARKRRTLGLVARVRVVAQRDVKVRRHQQRQSDEAQGGTTLLAVTALGQRAPFVERIDKGEEVGGIEQDLADIQSELPDQVGGQIALDGNDGVWGEAVHLVPEALAGQLLRAEVQEATQRRALIPGGDLHLAARIEATIEGGDQQVVSDAGSAWPTSGGDVAVDVLDQAQASGQVEQGHDGAELGDDRLLGRGGEGSRGLSQRGDDVVGAAEILLPDDLGLAVDAAAFACVVGGLPADGLLEEARHAIGHTATAACPSRSMKSRV